MSQALDLALLVTSGATSTPGIVHDPELPLVIGEPEAGEFLALIYNPVTRNMEMKVASDTLDVISTLTLHPDGTFLLNGLPISQLINEDLDEAVAAAAASATTAATQATNAAASAATAVTARDAAIAARTGFDTEVETALAEVDARIVTVTALANETEGNATAAQVASANSELWAGNSAASANEALQRASAPNDFIFPDGSKSAAAYANEARQIAQVSRAAATRILLAADFPEMIEPGFLFTRARVQVNSAVQVTIPPNIWSDASGEAWMTYRLETAGGSVQFVPQAGSVAATAPLFTGSIPVTMRRMGVGATTSTQHDGVAPVPTGYTGKLLLIVGISHNTSEAVTASAAFSGGLTPTYARAHVTPSDADFTVNYMVVETTITAWGGGDVTYSIVAGPNVNNIFVKPFLVETADAPSQIVVERPAGSFSSITGTLVALPAQALILAMAIQRGNLAAFVSWNSSVTSFGSGNTQGVGPGTGADSNASRNHGWGVGAGVNPSLGDRSVSATFNNATNRPTLCLVAYPPITTSPTDAVNAIFQGGRDTLNVVGAEAELWFNPDGRTVSVQIPAS